MKKELPETFCHGKEGTLIGIENLIDWHGLRRRGQLSIQRQITPHPNRLFQFLRFLFPSLLLIIVIIDALPVQANDLLSLVLLVREIVLILSRLSTCRD